MIEFFSSTSVFPLVAAVLGLCIGSFLNVLIHRLPVMLEREWQQQAAELRGEPVPELSPLSLSRPASRCPHCGTPIKPWQNLPLISFALLGGRCGHCKARISLRYPVVELLGGLAGAYSAWHFGFGWQAAAAMVFCWAMLALCFIDLDTQLLPDSITLPLLWLGLLLNLRASFVPLPDAVIGAAAGYLALWSVYWLFKLITGKEGMGYGDFKLLAAIGAWLGWQLLPMVILASAAIGALVGITLILVARHGRGTPIPFGPYLGGAGIVALFWGAELNAAYLAQF